MKRIYIFLVFLLATVGGMLHAETPVYNMGTKDGSNGEQTVDGSLLFYDKGGPTGTVQHAQTKLRNVQVENRRRPPDH